MLRSVRPGIALLVVLAALAPPTTATVVELAATGFTGTGMTAWTDPTLALVRDGNNAKTGQVEAHLRIAFAEPAIEGTVGSVLVHLDQTVTRSSEHSWTLTAYLGSGATVVAGPVGFPGSSTASVRTWDLTDARDWTTSELALLEVEATTKNSQSRPGSWRIDALWLEAEINRAPAVSPLAVSVPEEGVVAGRVVASDADGDVVTLAVATPPGRGSVVAFDAQTGDFTYAPARDAFGADSFLVTATDGRLNTSAAVTVDIQPVDDPPALAPDAFAIAEDVVLEIPAEALLANDAEPDGQALTVTGVHAAVGGGVELAAGVVRFIPGPDFHGPASFAYTATDGTSAREAGVGVTVRPRNDPPSFAAGPDVTLPYGAGPQVLDGWATAMTAGPPDESGQALWFAVVADNPLLFDAAPVLSVEGTLNFTPAASASGTSQVLVTLHDDGGSEDGGEDRSEAVTFLVTILAPPGAPAIRVGAAHATSEDAPVAIPFTVEDGDTAVEDLVVRVASGNPSVVPDEGLSLSFVDGSWRIDAVPAPDAFGVVPITIAADDGSTTTSTSTTLTVHAVNDLPVLVLPPDARATAGNATAFNVTVSDVETAAGDLLVAAAVTWTAATPAPAAIVSQDGPQRTVTVSAPLGSLGVGAIRIFVTDDAATVMGDIPFEVVAPPPVPDPGLPPAGGGSGGGGGGSGSGSGGGGGGGGGGGSGGRGGAGPAVALSDDDGPLIGVGPPYRLLRGSEGDVAVLQGCELCGSPVTSSLEADPPLLSWDFWYGLRWEVLTVVAMLLGLAVVDRIRVLRMRRLP